ncbi:MAG: hypothetical protein AB7P04_06255 [Bacteriovoracia bacterium]
MRVWILALSICLGGVAEAKPTRSKAPARTVAAAHSDPGKKVRYRTHTQLDFSGQAIQGKIRAPEVFYIFQRRRSEGHQVVTPPSDFHYHSPDIQKVVQEALGK